MWRPRKAVRLLNKEVERIPGLLRRVVEAKGFDDLPALRVGQMEYPEVRALRSGRFAVLLKVVETAGGGVIATAFWLADWPLAPAELDRILRNV
jgi:hypothetical protein